MRFLVCYIDPKSGRERLGTGPHAQTIANYANVTNVIRYFLGQEHFPVGQYHIYPYPLGSAHPIGEPTVAYKKAV